VPAGLAVSNRNLVSLQMPTHATDDIKNDRVFNVIDEKSRISQKCTEDGLFYRWCDGHEIVNQFGLTTCLIWRLPVPLIQACLTLCMLQIGILLL